jgi:PAS domain S-box-containing protein
MKSPRPTTHTPAEQDSYNVANTGNNKRRFSMNEGRFRLAFEKAPIGMAIVDLNHGLRRVNQSLCDALGYEAKELLGKNIIELTHPDDIKSDNPLVEQLLNGQISSYRLEKRFITKRGDLAWLDITGVLIRSDDDEPLYGLAMVEDVTNRRRAEEALRTSEERYRSFVVNSSEGIWRLEIEQPIDTTLPPDEQITLFYKYGYIAECNDENARMHGHKRADDMVGVRFGQLKLATHPTNVQTMRKLISSGYRLLDLETEYFDANGKTRYLATNLIGIVINNRLLRIWGVQRDRTEHRTAELKLEYSLSQLRALSAYLQSIREKERTELAREIHDTLGQSLTGIKIELSLLNKRLNSDKESDAKSMSEKLEELTNTVDDTIGSVKALATELRPGVLDKFGLSAAIEWKCEEFERRFGVQCKCNIPAMELELRDELSTALFRILQEALMNVATHAEAKAVTVDLVVDDQNAILIVSDDGKGITLDQLLAPTSLGLLGMRERAEVLNGSFVIEGKPELGTRVTVRIPLLIRTEIKEEDE